MADPYGAGTEPKQPLKAALDMEDQIACLF
jgi:hypothetical protein